LFESAISPFDWGTVEVRGRSHAAVLARFKHLLERQKPGLLALEQFEGEPTRRSSRIVKLARRMVAVAEEKRITVAILSRAEISAAFGGEGAKTRDEIAAFVARNVDALRDRLPMSRKVWDSENPSRALFDAAACALTWYAQNS
jgi:Holliday junction resolvasome RuvABC endonuclease subunit